MQRAIKAEYRVIISTLQPAIFIYFSNIQIFLSLYILHCNILRDSQLNFASVRRHQLGLFLITSSENSWLLSPISPRLKEETQYLVVNQSSNQPNQLVNKSVNQSFSQSVSQSFSQSFSQSVSHLVSQSVSQSFSQLVS